MRKALLLTKIVLLWLIAINTYADTNVSGTVSGTWNIAGSPYIVEADLSVDSGSVLTVEPGVEVVFTDRYVINVKGIITATGSESDPVVFTVLDESGYPNTHVGWGGIRISTHNDVTDSTKFEYCLFEYGYAYKEDDRNSELNNGGALHISSGKVSITNCTFNRNHAWKNGGAIYSVESSPKIENNIFTNNRTVNGNFGFGGGAMFVHVGNGTSRITGNYIADNFSARTGGGIYANIDNNAQLDIINNVVVNNTADYLTGIRCYGGGTVNIINNTVYGNTTDANGWAGGMYISVDTSVIKNNIIRDNYAPSGPQLYFYDDRNIEITNCNIEGGLEDIPGASYIDLYSNNIDVDPDFTDAAAGDFSLPNTSYCVNAGLEDISAFNMPSTDFLGNPRVYEGRIDMGAYESQTDAALRSPLIQDFDDIYIFKNNSKTIGIAFDDFDSGETHTITVSSSSPQVSIENQTGQVTGSTIDLVPDADWEGASTITVEVEDNNGLSSTKTFELNVSKSYCGNIDEHVIWDIDTVKVVCNFIINPSGWLEIATGTVVQFESGTGIHVLGRLTANGDESNKIFFTSADTSGFYNESHTGWDRIYFYQTSESASASSFKHCVFEFSKSDNAPLTINSYDNVMIDNCIFRYNRSRLGGGFRGYRFSGTIQNCLFHHNKASSQGGGISMWYGRPKLINNVIVYNYGGYYGGGFYSDNYYTTMLNNTICYNSARDRAGGLYLFGNEDGAFYNNIIWGNTTPGEGDQLYVSGSESSFYNNNIQGGFDSIAYPNDIRAYEDNINVHPYFVDSLNLDFDLTDSSGCINLGSSPAGISMPSLDIEGKERIFSYSVDIGAYEFHGEIKNRAPNIEPIPTQYVVINGSRKLTIIFSDSDPDDTHNIEISTTNNHLYVEDLTGDTTLSTFRLVAETGWSGTAMVSIKVTDDKGNASTVEFEAIVSKQYCGRISQDITWDLDTVKVLCDVLIEKDATLEITPGTILQFESGVRFEVQGKLIANGTKANPIVFTLNDTTDYYDENGIGWYGVFFNKNGSGSEFSHCIFEYVIHNYPGGAIHVSNSVGSVSIEYCTFRYNKANSIAFFNGRASIYNNTFRDNLATCISASSSSAYIKGNLFYNNSAYRGAAIHITANYYGTKIENNTFYHNQVTDRGGAVYIDAYRAVTFENNIFWGNKVGDVYNQIHVDNFYGGEINARYNVIQDGESGIAGNGDVLVYENNLDSNPDFSDTTSYDFSIDQNSVCFNAGNPLYQGAILKTDITGKVRVSQDTIDIGAFEYQFYDVDPPVFTEVTTDIVNALGSDLEVAIDEDGIIYLVLKGTETDIESIRTNSIDSVEAEANTASILTFEDVSDTLIVYAIDSSGNLSEGTEIITLIPAIVKITLYNTYDSLLIGEISDGDTINIKDISEHLNIRAIGNIEPLFEGLNCKIELSGAEQKTTIDDTPPFSLFGDQDGIFNSHAFNIGEYNLVAYPADANTEEQKGTSYSIAFTFVDGTTSPPPPPTSVESIAEGDILIFPNPVNDVLNIQFGEISNPSELSIKICSLSGQVVYENHSVSEGMLTIPVADIQNGLYLIQIQYGADMMTRKLIKN